MSNTRDVCQSGYDYEQYQLNELENENMKLKKQLAIATKVLEQYADEENWDDIRSYNFSIDDTYFVEKAEFREKGYELAKKSLEEMKGVK